MHKIIEFIYLFFCFNIEPLFRKGNTDAALCVVLTQSERACEASDDSNWVLGVCTELKQHRRESVPLALQL